MLDLVAGLWSPHLVGSSSFRIDARLEVPAKRRDLNNSAKPDFISIVANVAADCYPTSSAASAANTALANQLKDAMNSVRAQSDQEVLVNQGRTQRRPVYGPYDSNRNPTTICENWSATSDLELRLSNIAAWPGLQDKITQILDAAADTAKQAGSNPRTVGTINDPEPKLLPETSQKLNEAALLDAMDRAYRLANLAAKRISNSQCVLEAVSLAPDEGRPSPYNDPSERAGAPAPSPGGGQGVALSFGNLYEHVQIVSVFRIGDCPPGIKQP